MNSLDTSLGSLPPDHPLRVELNDEVHARPTPALVAPLRVSYLALMSGASAKAQEWGHLSALLSDFNHSVPSSPANYYFAQLDNFSIIYERHTEFSRYTIIAPGISEPYFDVVALEKLPRGWLAGIPGNILVASHGVIVPVARAAAQYDLLAARYFGGNAPVGSIVGDASGAVLTDFRLQPDGFGRFIIMDFGFTPRQTGRTLQRVLELETYRMLALLAFPVARQIGPKLTEYERELSQVTNVLESADAGDEAVLLDRLTHLQAQIESEEANSRFRFSAASAYHDLVKHRISELREERIAGLQTFGEFTERRLAPAMNTCIAAAARQEKVSEHIARANELLATRVDLTRERQNQALLQSMNRRAKAQFELQQTVEGLSIAAITYYVAGLAGYLAKGLHSIGWAVNYEIVTAASIPITVVLLMIGLRRVHRQKHRTKAD